MQHEPGSRSVGGHQAGCWQPSRAWSPLRGGLMQLIVASLRSARDTW
ncbi:hypothetical protein ACWC5I_08125 [Kitasatospora sp. NPDC001574]